MPVNCPALTGERGEFRTGRMTFKVEFLALRIKTSETVPPTLQEL